MTKKGNLALPERLCLANLPTPIERLDHLSEAFQKEIFIKRDDFTGFELSGNKVRKLEYALAEALNQGAKTIITCGAAQSNHARATAVAARKLGLNVHLVLMSHGEPKVEGNFLMNKLLGAKFTFLEPEPFVNHHVETMATLKKEYDAKGETAYILPLGASNGIGTFGYCHAFEEILEQEKSLGLCFDTIVCTIGSGGTYAGLVLGDHLTMANKKIIGFSISASSDYFKRQVDNILGEALEILGRAPLSFQDELIIFDGYAGKGYAISQPEELAFIGQFAKVTGIILDPVYTGKAMHGLVDSLKNGTLSSAKQILFIHTGGQMGFVPKFVEEAYQK